VYLLLQNTYYVNNYSLMAFSKPFILKPISYIIVRHGIYCKSLAF